MKILSDVLYNFWDPFIDHMVKVIGKEETLGWFKCGKVYPCKRDVSSIHFVCEEDDFCVDLLTLYGDHILMFMKKCYPEVQWFYFQRPKNAGSRKYWVGFSLRSGQIRVWK